MASSTEGGDEGARPWGSVIKKWRKERKIRKRGYEFQKHEQKLHQQEERDSERSSEYKKMRKNEHKQEQLNEYNDSFEQDNEIDERSNSSTSLPGSAPPKDSPLPKKRSRSLSRTLAQALFPEEPVSLTLPALKEEQQQLEEKKPSLSRSLAQLNLFPEEPSALTLQEVHQQLEVKKRSRSLSKTLAEALFHEEPAALSMPALPEETQLEEHKPRRRNKSLPPSLRKAMEEVAILQEPVELLHQPKRRRSLVQSLRKSQVVPEEAIAPLRKTLKGPPKPNLRLARMESTGSTANDVTPDNRSPLMKILMAPWCLLCYLWFAFAFVAGKLCRTVDRLIQRWNRAWIKIRRGTERHHKWGVLSMGLALKPANQRFVYQKMQQLCNPNFRPEVAPGVHEPIKRFKWYKA